MINISNSYIGGIFTKRDYLSPSYVKLNNPKYIEIDGMYYSSLLIVNYNRENDDLIFKSLVNTNVGLYLSIYYEKQDSYKVIKDLTYNIGNVKVDMEKIGENRQDSEIAAFTYNDAKYIRREMQINNEELYFIYTYITLYSESKEELEYNLNKIEGLIRSRGMQVKRAYFRQEQTYLASLPLMQNSIDIKETTKRNVLTNSIISTYPFISSAIFDEEGIFIGENIYNDSLIFIDKYDETKYKNANMCIFGTSGAGKSFFTKLMILRYAILNLEQYIIDPDREYTILGENLNGTVIKVGPSSKTYVNVLDIREESLEENQEGYLATKIGKLMGFFKLIFENIKEKEKSELEKNLIEIYKEKGITFEDKSLYKNGRFKNAKDMPKLSDLYNKLDKQMKLKLFPFVHGSLKFLNNYTNVKLENKLIIADIYELGEENIKYAMFIFIELFWDRIKKERNNKKAIYLDEIWRLIGVTSNKEVASFIYKIFKTIRKYGGSGVAITQDISDLFSLEEGTYGKSILNNSSIKVFFNLEEENIKVLEKYTNLSNKEKIEIKSFERGECLMFVGQEHILTKIKAADFEKELIKGGK